jgi:hypothetical protein
VVLCHRPDECGPGNAVEGVFKVDLDQGALDVGIQGGAKCASQCLRNPSYGNAELEWLQGGADVWACSEGGQGGDSGPDFLDCNGADAI